MMSSISAGLSVSVSSRSFAVQRGMAGAWTASCSRTSGMGHLLADDVDAVLTIGLLDVYLDELHERGRDVLADEVGPDGELTVATVDKYREANPRWAAEVHERVE